MVSVLRVHLPSDIPIVGCELTPYILILRPDSTVSPDDSSSSSSSSSLSLSGHFLSYKWYRIESDKKVNTCSIHASEIATLQCIACVKANIPAAKTYHCTSKCYSDAWQHHRIMHERATNSENKKNGAEEDESFAGLNSTGSGGVKTSVVNNATTLYPSQKNGDETWFEVGRSKTYTPSDDDIGHVLKFECVVVDVEKKLPVEQVRSILTSRVIPAPTPCPRRLIPVGGIDTNRRPKVSSNGTFTVLSYNILSDMYATSDTYSYCPSWALSWHYRRQNLLREIVGYRADIVCLQEVQSDHFEEFFAPELDKHGYQAIFKKRTQEGSNVDGCATIFRRDRFSHVKKYEVEFNKAAQSLMDASVLGTQSQRKNAIGRLIKDNVALIVVVEAKFSNQGVDNTGKRQLICVANTHVNVQDELKDVKVWQVHTLLKGLEKIAQSADIPMLVCGDFDAVPGSAPHALIAFGKVDPTHPDLAVDPLGILPRIGKLHHQLPLVSAYSSFARMGGGPGLEQYRRRMDPNTNEPLFTKCTVDFIGTLDYIFYSADSLTVESLLELVSEGDLRKDTALPSAEWSSDHIALLAEFRCKPKSRR